VTYYCLSIFYLLVLESRYFQPLELPMQAVLLINIAPLYSRSTKFKSWPRDRVARLLCVVFLLLWIFLDSTLKCNITAYFYILFSYPSADCCYVTSLCHPVLPFQTIIAGRYNSQKNRICGVRKRTSKNLFVH
jgi:hypothetical protein